MPYIESSVLKRSSTPARWSDPRGAARVERPAWSADVPSAHSSTEEMADKYLAEGQTLSSDGDSPLECQQNHQY